MNTLVNTATDIEIRPFTFDVSDEELDDLRQHIPATRWPEKEIVSDQTEGTTRAIPPLMNWGLSLPSFLCCPSLCL
jgi:hypothetical protein